MEIYYFSGTGNTFVVARDIAGRLNAGLISIPKVMDQVKIQIDALSIGIVFPSYLAALVGLPLVVEQFVKKIADIDTKHIFAVCTCGGYECVNALPSLKRLKQVIKSCGGKLAAGYSVRLPMNNLDYDHIPIPINKDHDSIIKISKTRIDEICDRITKSKAAKYQTAKALFNLAMTPFYNMMRPAVIKALRENAKESPDSKLEYFELIPLTDKSITVDENCNGCGTCAKICPVRNIRIVDNKPEWQHRCEMCFACDEWCPAGAIHHWGRAKGVKYRHPGVKMTDMFYV